MDSSEVPRSATADCLRIVVVFRSDLPEMNRAKSEVQFGHAVAMLLLDPALPRPVVEQYLADNQPKINMEVDDLAALEKIAEKAANRKVHHVLVKDAAHTVFSEPTITCIALGPLSKTDCNALTRHARMRV